MMEWGRTLENLQPHNISSHTKIFPLSSVNVIKNNQVKEFAKIKKKSHPNSEPEENMVTWSLLLTASYLRSL